MATHLIENAAESVGMLGMELFGYNRQNFKYDRKQRLKMEYELAEMRVKQAELWRDDVRQTADLTPKKMEMYLIVIALELGFCVMALCKARVPAGAPPWLVACHTLSVCGSLMYLFLALWFGMHAFVSAQAYKVRILTQMVRLPIPSWSALEACRTYMSAFEKLNKSQMLRVPFLGAAHEPKLRRGTNAGVQSPGVSAQRVDPSVGSVGSGQESSTGGMTVEEQVSADPWGLERRGDNIPELAPTVNRETERQRHIWLVREAGRYYHAYDAFCRISMSAGTSWFAVFLCYYCLSYVLTENAAPVAAGAGMLIFLGCSLVIMRADLKLSTKHSIIAATIQFISPAIASVVTFVSSRNGGHPGSIEYLMPFALFLHGAWILYYLWLFDIKESHTGLMLAMAFRKVLFLDSFGWAKHQINRSRQAGRALWMPRTRSAYTLSGMTVNSENENDTGVPQMPCNQSVGAVPRRPEDTDTGAVGPQAGMNQRESDEAGLQGISFKPNTFAGHPGDEDEDTGGDWRRKRTFDAHGERPGLTPWRIFLFNSLILTMMWWVGAWVALVNSFRGRANFRLVRAEYGARSDTTVHHVPLLQGEAVVTKWSSPVTRPRGFACGADGDVFLTSGRVAGGRMRLLHSRMASKDGNSSDQHLSFAPAPECLELQNSTEPIQDLTILGCKGDAHCSAMVLPRRGKSLISCPLPGSNGLKLAVSAQKAGHRTLPIRKAWLNDRGGVQLDDAKNMDTEGLLHPEELSSVGTAPCIAATTNSATPSGSQQGDSECVVVGTTGRRVVQMMQSGAEKAQWIPKQLLHHSHEEVPGPGAFAFLGGRYLGVLERQEGLLHFLDLHQGGQRIGSWQLPYGTEKGVPKDWAAICAGGDHIYALEDKADPSVWRFSAPQELLTDADQASSSASHLSWFR